MEKKQTAVEWLVNQLDKNFILDQILNNDYTVDILIGQAKEMEKEQIEHTYKTCWKDYAYGGKHWEMGMDPNETFKSYYNETYGNER